MFKFLLLFCSLFVCGPAFANTQFIVAKGGTKATVILIGSPSDNEARRFYDSLTAPETDFQGKWSKVFLYDNAFGERVLSASCVFSKILKENGTCTITLFPVSGVTIDGGGRGVEYISPDSVEAAHMAEGFIPADANGLIYTNGNGHFRIESRSGKAGVEGLTLTYK